MSNIVVKSRKYPDFFPTEVIFGENCRQDIDGAQEVYLMKFFDENGLIWTKIGTTTKSCSHRVREQIRYYRDHGYNLKEVVIEQIVDCGIYPAEGFESFGRAYFIKKFPNTWNKNDRFFNVDIPFEDFMTLWEMYSNI